MFLEFAVAFSQKEALLEHNARYFMYEFVNFRVEKYETTGNKRWYWGRWTFNFIQAFTVYRLDLDSTKLK